MKKTKKIKLLSVLLCLTFILPGCGNTSATNETTMETTTKHEHTLSEATCTEAPVCSECGEKVGKALGHTTKWGYCERCGEYVMAYQDEFDQINTCMTDVSNEIEIGAGYNLSDDLSQGVYLQQCCVRINKKLNQAYDYCGNRKCFKNLKKKINKAIQASPANYDYALGTIDGSIALLEQWVVYVKKIKSINVYIAGKLE